MAQALAHTAPARKPDLSGSGLRTFSNIADRWSLSEQEQMKILGVESRSTLHSWKSKAKARQQIKLGRDTLERISYVLGIYKAINILLPIAERADRWMHAPNDAPIFGGKSALDRITSGNVSDLFIVRQYLDAERG